MVFNLRADIGERQDLANQRQDIARRLRLLLTDWERDVDTEAAINVPEFAAGRGGARGAQPAGGRGAAGAGRGAPANPSPQK
jgi:hypothetical protein